MRDQVRRTYDEVGTLEGECSRALREPPIVADHGADGTVEMLDVEGEEATVAGSEPEGLLVKQVGLAIDQRSWNALAGDECRVVEL